MIPIFYWDLLWGQGLYYELRFVLVNLCGRQEVLVSTNQTLAPEAIIRLYARRFTIETSFRNMKQTLGAFTYHFWSRSLPKLKRYAKKGESQPLDQVNDPDDRERIRQTVKAMEGYMMCSLVVSPWADATRRRSQSCVFVICAPHQSQWFLKLPSWPIYAARFFLCLPETRVYP